ncbi:MAG: cupin domain-containing protein [Micrococcaceae bacterium]
MALIPEGPETTETPEVLTNAKKLMDDREAANAVTPQGGAAWNLDRPARDLDSNVIVLPPGDAIAAHAGPELDVLITVLRGAGVLLTHIDDEPAEVALVEGDIVWLPRHSTRGFQAGDQGLCYLTVHQRKPGLRIMSGPPSS